MEILVLPAPAKLNLFLHITGRRADGYHLLQTLFVFLDFVDEITLSVREDGRICRPQGAVDVPEDADLTVRAARLLQQETGCHLGADISVQKNIPMGGGLGGGSSDAATVLQGLNRLWHCGLDDDHLAALGLRLGADVPVFVRGRAAWAEGVGEILTPVDLPLVWYVVIHPGVPVPTAQLFAAPDLTRDCPPITLAAFHAGQGSNVFQPVVERCFPEVARAIGWLTGYAKTRLTGSGSCLFATVSSKQEGENILRGLPSGWFGFVAQGHSVSPLQQKLVAL
ncbi:MAG TPA: 4-(cytidine 5'-diphospho)-2-C-methyl-D-erythritol kinase [Candidatus Thiothrix moscowensis]|uniref:4-(cytidine 5'-diphospho)-2-C-methyl-D-erythritol kinase n=1 Tax=unclassified Thiothrix TaxID=2636184 RepID=UPI0025D094E0|nr:MULTISPECIES: 4-(cytidine 5'-diphospho)-2-C-methyl-D-erythritol kinase [unclassified Thiothrix]HRJ53310.1 4-(cytidine 5'-diphospho)-2-C-methyl-D-erythritol kinase [Candidatus Thiothrix moscowensis]HRJ94149.1 4-(cytidine 5'-diphospho)-2-C-methyl-D-erythritol kinase [Candidatus Thiothrix moscowensis]